MGSLKSFAGKSNNPYRDEGLNKIYNLLFCDQIDLFKSENQPGNYPWDSLLASNPGADLLISIANDNSLEARLRILAYRLLSGMGQPIKQKELLAVIIEVSLPEGLDVLAAFAEGTARYINHAEKLLIWETQTDESNRLITRLFSSANDVVSQIGPWDQDRRPFPENGMARMSFLVSDGLYFGEAPFEVLLKDPLGGPVLDAATQLMAFLVQQAI